MTRNSAKGWDARDSQFQGHRAFVYELDETNEGGQLHFRWECSCRRDGAWTENRDAAEKGARAHARRFAAKRPKQTPFRQGLQDLLTLG